MYDSFKKRNQRKQKVQQKQKLYEINKYLDDVKKSIAEKQSQKKGKNIPNISQFSRKEKLKTQVSEVRYQSSDRQLLTKNPIQSKEKLKLSDQKQINKRVKTQSFFEKQKLKEEDIINKIQEISKKIKNHSYKNSTKPSIKLIKNTNGIYPLSVNVHISKLDLLSCGNLQKTIKIIKEEDQPFDGSIVQNEKGLVVIYWKDKKPIILQIQFTSIIKINFSLNYLMAKFSKGEVNSGTILIKFTEMPQEAQKWEKYLKFIHYYEANKKDNRSKKWEKIGIKSSIHNKSQQVEIKQQEMDQQQEKQKFHRKSIIILKKDRSQSKAKIQEKSPQTNRNNVTVNIIPILKSQSKITLHEKKKKVQEDQEGKFSPRMLSIPSQKIKQKIEEKKKLLEMAKQTSLGTDNYWTQAEKQADQVKPYLNKIQKRRTQYTPFETQIQNRRKVNTNDNGSSQIGNSFLQIKGSEEGKIREKKKSYVSIFGKSSDQSKSINKSITSSKKGSYENFPDSSRKKGKHQKLILHKMVYQESRKLSKQLTQNKQQQQEQLDESISYESESTDKRQEDFVLELQELKNGIVLKKCSENGFSAKEKKLFLSENQFQLCYSDIKYKNDEKKIFIEDIIEIEYEQYDKGIIKHCKEFDPKRCMTITFKQGTKKKIIQFLLVKEPIQNLESFCSKLKSFHERTSKGVL